MFSEFWRILKQLYSQVAVCIVHQMGQGDERVVERLTRGDAPFLVQRQHALQKVNELPPVHLLRHEFAAFEVSGHVDLKDERGGLLATNR